MLVSSISLSLPENYYMRKCDDGGQPGYCITVGAWLRTTEPFESASKAIEWAISDSDKTRALLVSAGLMVDTIA